jgi:hypothetical protein
MYLLRFMLVVNIAYGACYEEIMDSEAARMNYHLVNHYV